MKDLPAANGLALKPKEGFSVVVDSFDVSVFSVFFSSTEIGFASNAKPLLVTSDGSVVEEEAVGAVVDPPLPNVILDEPAGLLVEDDPNEVLADFSPDTALPNENPAPLEAGFSLDDALPNVNPFPPDVDLALDVPPNENSLPLELGFSLDDTLLNENPLELIAPSDGLEPPNDAPVAAGVEAGPDESLASLEFGMLPGVPIGLSQDTHLVADLSL